MNYPANYSGKQIVKLLQKYFGFVFISQKGSHIKLNKLKDGSSITVIVPNHAELATGTLHNILRQARIEPAEFLKISGKER